MGLFQAAHGCTLRLDKADGLPLSRLPSAEGEASRRQLANVEQGLIVVALRGHAGHVTLAARSLGVSRDTLRYLIEKYVIRRSDNS